MKEYKVETLGLTFHTTDPEDARLIMVMLALVAAQSGLVARFQALGMQIGEKVLSNADPEEIDPLAEDLAEVQDLLFKGLDAYRVVLAPRLKPNGVEPSPDVTRADVHEAPTSVN